MTAKRTVLAALTREWLVDVAYACDADFGPTGMSRNELLDPPARP